MFSDFTWKKKFAPGNEGNVDAPHAYFLYGPVVDKDFH